MDFKIGDKVIVTGGHDEAIFKNHTGKVYYTVDDIVQIKFDLPFYDYLGNKHGHGADSACWNFSRGRHHMIKKYQRTTFNESLIARSTPCWFLK